MNKLNPLNDFSKMKMNKTNIYFIGTTVCHDSQHTVKSWFKFIFYFLHSFCDLSFKIYFYLDTIKKTQILKIIIIIWVQMPINALNVNIQK